MDELTITCPKCKEEFKLTETISAPLIEKTRREFEAKLAAKESAYSALEAAIREKEAAVAADRAAIGDQVAKQVAAERKAIAVEEARKAKLALQNDLDTKSREVTDLQSILAEKDKKLEQAQGAQAELLRKQRELEDAKREVGLTVEKGIQAGLEQVRDKAKKEAEEQLALKVTERELIISGLKGQIEDLKRRAEQGSQQLQGEAQEVKLEDLLRETFTADTIEPVPKGEHGGDALHRVLNPGGKNCGTILWESKRTKNWSDGWLAKLRKDQRDAKAEIAVIVTQALPDGVESFSLIDGVWVVNARLAMPVAAILRQSLIDVSAARIAGEGQQTKAEMLYQYLTGPNFRRRIEAIVEAFSTMQDDLDKEKKAIQKQWAKREAQIETVMQATVGMYGDLQGIAGKSIKEIDGLSLKMLEAPSAKKGEEA